MGHDLRRIMAEQVELATPAERLMMVWGKLMADLRQAQLAMSANNHEQANRALISAQQILVILSRTLDPSWEGTARLTQLYRWCWEKLVAANVAWDSARLKEASDVLSQLYAAWSQAAEGTEAALVLS